MIGAHACIKDKTTSLKDQDKEERERERKTVKQSVMPADMQCRRGFTVV